MTISILNFAILMFTRALWEAELDLACHVFNLLHDVSLQMPAPFPGMQNRAGVHFMSLAAWLKIRYVPRNAA